MIDLISLVKECSPHVAPETMLTIIRTESSGNHLVVNDNTTKTSYKPKTKEEAVNLSYVLIKNGHNLDFGLTQINLINAKKFKLTLNKIFDPCENIKHGAKIFTQAFLNASKVTNNEQYALLKAFSTYNTGNPHKGFKNGYVNKIIENASKIKVSDIE
ncbi:lytic transglycosylase domain-containing protein [Silvanigrella paludirubra]|nr:lytic transglycosylase domain-containing protein [Silvanigrella paludirubra]